MGDRANVHIQADAEDPGVWFYTHWNGSELAATVQSALARGRDRWDDTPYLGRIIFCEMVKGETQGTSGFGISSSIGDNSHPVITLVAQEIFLVEDGKEQPDTRQSFEAFTRLNADALSKWYGD